jgi:hypothetical protein
MTLHADHLYAATDSRLFELRPADLTVIRQWERRLLKYAMQMVPDGSRLAMANWLNPSIGIFDRNTERTRRLTVGRQPLLTYYGGVIKVLAGFDGGMWTLDTQRARLTQAKSTPAVTAVAAGAHLWAVLAGPAERLALRVADSSVKRGSDRIIRLTGEPWMTTLGGSCSRLVCDDMHDMLWCIIDRGSRAGGLQAVSQATGHVVRSYIAGPGRTFAHVDAGAGVAFTMEPDRVVAGNRIVSCTSTLTCYSIR